MTRHAGFLLLVVAVLSATTGVSAQCVESGLLDVAAGGGTGSSLLSPFGGYGSRSDPTCSPSLISYIKLGYGNLALNFNRKRSGLGGLDASFKDSNLCFGQVGCKAKISSQIGLYLGLEASLAKKIRVKIGENALPGTGPTDWLEK